MVELKHIGVFSTAKFYGVTGFIIGLLTAILVFLFGTFAGGMMLPLPVPAEYGLPMVAAGIVIFYTISGFIGGAITAFAYNIIAGVIGGIDVTFTKKEAPGAMPMQTTAATAGTMGAASATGVVKSSGVTTAVNPELLNYVKGELAAKRGKEEVVSELVKAGWSQNDIQAALDAAVLG